MLRVDTAGLGKRHNSLQISGFRREVDEICTLFAAFLDFLTFEDGTDRLSRNVGEELPLLVA